MKRLYFCLFILILTLMSGLVFGQTGSPLEIHSEIGRALPRTIVYDPQFEQYAVVDAYGRLLLVDAQTFDTKHILYKFGSYNDIQFSHDGRWLALAIGTRIELWDTQTGTLAADLVDLGQSQRIIGPLSFSRDDRLLVFHGIYPAPRDIRMTEYDTVTVPWVWNLPAAREEAPSTFPAEREAWQFFDYRNGFVLGPDDRIVAALPGRLHVLDAYTLDVLFEIPTERYEQDPMAVWFSLVDNQIYVRPVMTNSLIQVDTERGVLVEIPLNKSLTEDDLDLIGGIELSGQAQLIGEAGSRGTTDLLNTLLGRNYRQHYEYYDHPLTITLIDFLMPPASVGDNIAPLVFIFDEEENTGQFLFINTWSVQQIVFSHDENRLLIRQRFDEEFVVTYDVETGRELRRFIPSLRAIGSYRRSTKNRVLAYDKTGTVIVSDFQRIDADSTDVLAEDLRYARNFERFYFTDDSAHLVTLSGSEWRLWDANTGEVERREVVSLRGDIVSTSSDGYRFLTRYYNSNDTEGMEVVDMETETRRSVNFEAVGGSYVEQIYPNPEWTQFLVVYSANSWGQYYPGNQIAMYDLEEGKLWFIAGDDLPPAETRHYGWVDNETVFVRGEGYVADQPERIFGVDYAPSGLPQCAVEAFPGQVDQWVDLWERLVLRMRPDKLHLLTQFICADLPDEPEAVAEMLLPTATVNATPTPQIIGDIPVCLTAYYYSNPDDYAQSWEEITADLSPEMVAELNEMLCEGVGRPDYGAGSSPYVAYTMMIDSASGERATGAFTPREIVRRPIEPIQDLFERTYERSMGPAVLSPDEQFVAASSMPGELVIYRLNVSYQSMLNNLTSTAVTNLERQNLIAALPSPSPTYDVVGTARPTLTPTMTQTPIPRPTEQVFESSSLDMCPAETLYTPDNLPANYTPSGRIVAQIFGEDLWLVEPETGFRAPDTEQTVPPCGNSWRCQFSPDRSWILATVSDELFVIRPDGSDHRTLFDQDDRWPYEVKWSGANTIEYMVTVAKEVNGIQRFFDAWQRDILGVSPDPEPWIPEITINEINASLVSRQPGGSLAVARTMFSTGISAGYKYYLYNTENGAYEYFARIDEDLELEVEWHPLGDRLFYRYPDDNYAYYDIDEWYEIDVTENTNLFLDVKPFGTWSNEGRYRAYSTNRRTQPVAVWDSETGQTRTYCIPENGARLYEGSFTWSPDSRYLALQTTLPKDETEEGVGQHTLILDVKTGEMVDLTTGITSIIDWSRDEGGYGE